MFGRVGWVGSVATPTATSIICAKCGVYAGAILTDDDKSWSIANTRGLAMPEFEGRTGEHMDYEQETAEERIARRKKRWTPTVVQASAYSSKATVKETY